MTIWTSERLRTRRPAGASPGYFLGAAQSGHVYLSHAVSYPAFGEHSRLLEHHLKLYLAFWSSLVLIPNDFGEDAAVAEICRIYPRPRPGDICSPWWIKICVSQQIGTLALTKSWLNLCSCSPATMDDSRSSTTMIILHDNTQMHVAKALSCASSHFTYLCYRQEAYFVY